MIKAIFAMDSAGGIGHEKKEKWETTGEFILPWPHNETDLNHFKEITMGHIVVMGRKTWESQGILKPLPGRINAVVSSKTIRHPDTFIHNINPNNIEEDIRKLDSLFEDKDVFIIGGKQLLMSTRHMIDYMHVTHIRGIYEASLRLDKRILLEGFELRSAGPLIDNCTFEDYARETIFKLTEYDFKARYN